jgi:hypothetical protein
MTRAIIAASAYGARGRASCKRQVSGSNPLTGSQVKMGMDPLWVSVRGTSVAGRGCLAAPLLPSRTVAVESVCTPRVVVRHGCRIHVDQCRAGADLDFSGATAIWEPPGCPVRQLTTRPPRPASRVSSSETSAWTSCSPSRNSPPTSLLLLIQARRRWTGSSLTCT